MKLKQRLVLIAYFLLIPFLAWSGPTITNIGGGGGGSMTYPGAGIAKSTGGAWDTSLTVGSDLQAWATLLDGLSGLTPATNGVIGWNGSQVLGVYTTHIHDNSAPQFNDASDSTKKVLIDPSNQSANGTGTIKAPASGTAVLASGTQVAHDGTTLNLSAVHFVTTGTIRGGVDNYTLATNTNIDAASQYGSMFYVTAQSTQSMASLASGMNVCFFVASSAQVRIDPGASDAIWLTGVASGAGAYIQSSTLGDSVCLIYKSVNNWWAHKNGTWASQ